MCNTHIYIYIYIYIYTYIHTYTRGTRVRISSLRGEIAAGSKQHRSTCQQIKFTGQRYIFDNYHGNEENPASFLINPRYFYARNFPRPIISVRAPWKCRTLSSIYDPPPNHPPAYLLVIPSLWFPLELIQVVKLPKGLVNCLSGIVNG